MTTLVPVLPALPVPPPGPLPDLALIPVANPPDIQSLARMAVQSLASPSSRRNYAAAITRYLARGQPLNRESVQAYMNELREGGAGPVTRNISLAAIRLLAREANLRGMLPDIELSALERIRGAKLLGQRTGNWLDLPGVRLLLETAGQGRYGVRDHALLALMLGCGLRRAEVCALVWGQYVRREGRMVLVDLAGKGGRIRTIPVPSWAAEALDLWGEQATGQANGRPDDARIFPMTPQNVYLIVLEASRRAGLGEVAPHDLRRSHARLMRSAGVSVEQIGLLLGHASIQTTERYLGTKLELRPGMAGTDQIRLDK